MIEKKPTLTVFTPTYNRAHLLHRCYESLQRQSCHDFEWLVIDDGSTDNTKDVVEDWIAADNFFKITYVYKENGGLHTGYNKAIELMDTELCVCIDSDDWMPDDAVEIIVNEWSNYRMENVSGLVGHDYYSDGYIIGGNFPHGKKIHYIELKENVMYNCDNKIVMRVDLLKKVAPQPSFPNEKNFNPIWMVLKIDQIAPFVLIDRNLCFVDYQEGGMSFNLINQYFNSPNSFLELRKLYISLEYASWKYKLRNYVHFVAQSYIAKKNPFHETNNLLLITIVFPFGWFLYLYMLCSHSRFNKRKKASQNVISKI